MIRSAVVPAFVLAAALAPLAARSQDAPSVRSTGQIEAALEPAKTARTVQLEMPAVGASSTYEATQKRSEAVEHVLEPLGPGMLEIRVAARSGASWITVFRDDAETPESGTTWDQKTTMWISQAGASKRLRIVTHVSADETPYRVMVKRSAAD